MEDHRLQVLPEEVAVLPGTEVSAAVVPAEPESAAEASAQNLAYQEDQSSLRESQ